MKKRCLAAVLSVAVVSLALVSVAAATTSNPISGTVGSAWYESTTNRYVSTPNTTISAQLSSFTNDGIALYIKAANGAESNIADLDNKNSKVVDTGVPSGTNFHNVYVANNNTCTFSGSEVY